MKRAQAALALALLGAISALCLKGMKKIGDLLERDAGETNTEDRNTDQE